MHLEYSKYLFEHCCISDGLFCLSEFCLLKLYSVPIIRFLLPVLSKIVPYLIDNLLSFSDRSIIKQVLVDVMFPYTHS